MSDFDDVWDHAVAKAGGFEGFTGVPSSLMVVVKALSRVCFDGGVRLGRLQCERELRAQFDRMLDSENEVH